MQCRWEHVNRNYSALTEVQALMLDGHFIMEHAGRNWSGRFFNFNGTAGVWRRSAIADAGDWQHDTLTEDMDLSYRAQLRGWKFVYLPEIAAPAELPVEMSAFKSQQFRWAKGSVQVAKKLLGTIFRSNATWEQKSEAFFHLTNNLAYPLLLVLSILLLPNLALRTHHGWREVLMIDFPLFFGTTLSIASFYLASQREIALLRDPDAKPRFQWRVLGRLPLTLSIGIGLCVNQTRAVLEALAGKETEFVRTPKHGIGTSDKSWWSKKYHSAKSVTPFLELAMAALLRHRGRRRHRSRALHVAAVPGPVPVRLRLRRLRVAVAGQRGRVVAPRGQPPDRQPRHRRRPAARPPGDERAPQGRHRRDRPRRRPVPARPRNLRLIDSLSRLRERVGGERSATLARRAVASGDARAGEGKPRERQRSRGEGGVGASAGQACAARNAR